MTQRGVNGVRDAYDVVVIGAGLGGMTCANRLARAGRSVLLLEQHTQLGGLATWFRRKGHLFDVALHGFPVGMIKTVRKYWSKEVADRITQLRGIRFDNPQFRLTTDYTREDFTRLLVEDFSVPAATVQAFFDHTRSMNFYDDDGRTTRELFEEFFPGRTDVVRLLMEPITYANGSTLDDPAISYGIVFSNFMSKGVYTFHGGTDEFIGLLEKELLASGVDVRTKARAERILTEPDGRVVGVAVNGVTVGARSVVSNGNLKSTVLDLLDADVLPADFRTQAEAVRINTSSCQVYIGLKEGETIDYMGDLVFTSTAPTFDTDAMLAKEVTSRTYSVYYPENRQSVGRTAIVASSNARYEDWTGMSEELYKADKARLAEATLDDLSRYLPRIREMYDHLEVATPRTFERYTLHRGGSSFGTKFEGLPVSQNLPQAAPGLFHTGSVAIIMSGWLGAANYGVIVANEVDKYLGRGQET
ncbi:MAG: NAD(P)/FAD-dependent oxidoreductase [Nitrospinae bacterium]|nr:NAD(P)/FAD-dependent oxidoreductase [Nitrospinota bacterium]